MRYLLLLCFVSFTGIGILNAQNTDTSFVKKKFKPERIRILVGVTYAPVMPLIQQNDNYAGSIHIDDSTRIFGAYHKKQNLYSNHKGGCMQFSLQANFWNHLYTGLHYEFFTIKNYKRRGKDLFSKQNSMFFAIAASVGYSFEFLKNKNLQLMPTFRIGGYAADSYYDALGKKIYTGIDVKLRYFIKNKFGFSVGVDYEYFRYKAKGFSELYQKETYQKTTLNNLYFNIGFAYNINIRLDK